MSTYVEKYQQIRRSNATVPVPNKKRKGMKRERTRSAAERAAIRRAS